MCLSPDFLQAGTIKSIQDDDECLFTKKNARLVGEIYVLSNSMNDPMELLSYIREHKEDFTEDGIAVKLTWTLGIWMVQQDKSSLNRKRINQAKDKLAECQITEEYAYNLLKRLHKSEVSLSDLGNELILLSRILPCLARGDLISYLEMRPECKDNLKDCIIEYEGLHNSDPQVAQIITKKKNCYRRIMADQISLLALISEL
jgi:hypothetical protein